MIELVFVACTLIGECRNEKLSFIAQEIPVFACAKYGQHELAKWSGEHPGWRVKKWRCRPAGLYAKA